MDKTIVYAKSGLFTGFVGDIFLQKMTEEGYMKYNGIEEYFKSWNDPITPAISAAGLTAFWSGFAKYIGMGGNAFIPFMGLVDEIYRVYHPVLYPSLKPYYENNTRERTILYNMISAMMVLFVKNTIFK